jgi:hypothetical protein
LPISSLPFKPLICRASSPHSAAINRIGRQLTRDEAGKACDVFANHPRYARDQVRVLLSNGN